MKINPVSQKHISGCGIACVAYVLNISYDNAHLLFDNKLVITDGAYCIDIVSALKKYSKLSKYFHYSNNELITNDIVYIKPNAKYITGHWQVRCHNQMWMNSWINIPTIDNIISGFETVLSSEIEWVVRVI